MCGSIFGGGAKPPSPSPAPIAAPPPPPVATESQKGTTDTDKLRRQQAGFASTVKTSNTGPSLKPKAQLGATTLGGQ